MKLKSNVGFIALMVFLITNNTMLGLFLLMAVVAK